MSEGIVIRNTQQDNTSLIALSSLLSAPLDHDIAYLDGSYNGVTDRVNDVLNMHLRMGRQVFVQRTPKLPHSMMLKYGLKFGCDLKWDRIHHFDEDVAVLPLWWSKPFDSGMIQAYQLSESVDKMKHESVTTHGLCKYVSAAGFTVETRHITGEILWTLTNSAIQVFEDVLLCSELARAGVKSHVLRGVALHHCSRDTGGKYVGSTIDMLCEKRSFK